MMSAFARENLPSGNKRSGNFCKGDGGRSDLEQVAVYENEISVIAGSELPLMMLVKLRVRRTLSVCIQSLSARELVFRIVSLRALLVHASYRGIKPAKRSNGLNGIVSAKRQRNSGVEKRLPRIGV